VGLSASKQKDERALKEAVFSSSTSQPSIEFALETTYSVKG
jgi:hypothetical protein